MARATRSFPSLLEAQKSAARSPLGIISLFIVLVYGIASLTLFTSNLAIWNQTIICGFLVLFPCVVLWSFHTLVVSHFFKLFAPGDVGADTFKYIIEKYAVVTQALSPVVAPEEESKEYGATATEDDIFKTYFPKGLSNSANFRFKFKVFGQAEKWLEKGIS